MSGDTDQQPERARAGGLELDREELARVERLGAIGTWHWDLDRDRIELSDGARAVLGITDEPRTYTFEEVTSIVQLGEPERVDELIQALREGGPAVHLRTHATTPAGERREFESWMEPARHSADGRPRELRGIIQDVTDRRRAERERESVHEVTRVLAESVSIGEAIERVLGAIAETADWRAATFWAVDEGERALRCERVWLAAGLEDRLEPFADATVELELERGRGVPGMAWADRRTVWREVDPEDDRREFPRAPIAKEVGLGGIVAFPLIGGDEVIGVIELWRESPAKPPDELTELVGSFGSLIGQFIERTRAEAKLQESRTLTASVIDAALECVITIDALGHVLDWNPAAERTFGYRRPEALGRELAELIVPERHRARHRQALGRAREGGEGRLLGRRVELEALRANGEEFPVELTISRIGADPPTFTGWVRDITDRRRAEAAIRESRRLLAETQRLAQIGSWEWDLDADEVRVSEEVHRLLGLDPEEGSYAFGRLLDAVDPEHRERLRAAVEQCAAGDRELEYLRTPLVDRDPGVRVAEWFAAPVERGDGGRLVHGTVQNVTPEAELEAELETRARQQAAVARLGSEALFATDVDSVIGSAVATVAETLGIEHCAVMEVSQSGEGMLLRSGVGWREGIAGSLVVPVGLESHSGTVIESGVPVISDDLAAEDRFAVPDELLGHGLKSGAAVVIAGDGGPIGALGAYSTEAARFGEDDVTFLQGVANVLAAAFAAERATALERRLQQAQRLDSMGKLAGGIAHDFNNLLAVILNYADFALDPSTEEGGREEIAEIKRAAERAAALTRQLLIFSRKDATPDGVVRAAEVVTGMEPILSRAVGEHMRLEIRTDPDLRPVRIAESLLEQVLLNLVLNSGDAMPDGGEIVVELANAPAEVTGLRSAEGPYVRLSVVDEGAGMTPEVLDRAFEPFFTTKGEGQGTGLGLATCYGIVERAGGRIEIESEPGRGTRVDVYLVAGVDSPAASRLPEEGGKRPVGGHETVLLVEDEEPLRRVTRRILEGAGYTVLDADSADAALEVWGRHGPEVDVLLTDVVMPDRSGVELWHELADARPGLEAIYMSGYSVDSVAGRADAPHRLLEKPFTSAELLAAVRAALSGGGGS